MSESDCGEATAIKYRHQFIDLVSLRIVDFIQVLGEKLIQEMHQFSSLEIKGCNMYALSI